MIRLVPLMLLMGCPWIGPETHDQNFADTDANGTSEITLTSVEPAFGPTALLTDVVLTGEGFEPDEAANYAISVGGLNITDLQVTETSVSFTMPALATAGPVDIVFLEFDDDEGDTLEATLEQGFEYFTNRAQFTGLYGIAETFRHVNGDWPRRQADGGRIFAAFLTPTASVSAVELFAQTPGSCLSAAGFPDVVGIAIDDSDLTFRNSNGVDLELERTAATEPSYETGQEFTVSNSDMRDEFDLLPIVGGPELPSFGIPGIFDMPPEIQANSQSVNIAGGVTSEGRFLFSWVHEEDSTDHVVIVVDTFSSDWSQYFGQVACVANDAEGQFRIPNGTIDSWADGNMMAVRVGRMRTVENILPHDASGVVFPAINYTSGFMMQAQ